MADRLTQLQDCLDQLVVQMHSCIMYITTHAPYAHIEGQPDMDPIQDKKQEVSQTQSTSQGTTQPTENAEGDQSKQHTPHVFQESLQELAQDLVIRQQQIEYIISVLPGIGTSEKEQEARLKELEEQLKAVEAERVEAAKEKDTMQEELDAVIMRVNRHRLSS